MKSNIQESDLPLPLAMLSLLVLALAVSLLPGVAHAAPPDVKVDNARIRLLPGDLPLAGYFDLTNTGSEPVTLVGAGSPAFGKVMLHRSLERKGQSQMQHVSELVLAPAETAHFAPGDYHLMLMQRSQPLQIGDKVTIRLRFSDGRETAVDFRVGGAGIQ